MAGNVLDLWTYSCAENIQRRRIDSKPELSIYMLSTVWRLYKKYNFFPYYHTLKQIFISIQCERKLGVKGHVMETVKTKSNPCLVTPKWGAQAFCKVDLGLYHPRLQHPMGQVTGGWREQKWSTKTKLHNKIIRLVIYPFIQHTLIKQLLGAWKEAVSNGAGHALQRCTWRELTA